MPANGFFHSASKSTIVYLSRARSKWRRVRHWIALLVIGFAAHGCAAPSSIGDKHSQAVAALSLYGVTVEPIEGDETRLSVSASNANWGELTPERFWQEIAQLCNEAIVGLDLSKADEITDLAPVVGLTNLKALNLSDADGITDLTPLAGLANLETLDLSGAKKISDLTPLTGLVNLKTLDFSEAGGISDLSLLAGLTNLQTLNLGTAGEITDVSGLVTFLELLTGKLRIYNQFTDVTPLAGLTNLRKLDISGAKGVTDLSPLSGLTNLQTLNLTSLYQPPLTLPCAIPRSEADGHDLPRLVGQVVPGLARGLDDGRASFLSAQ